MGVAAQHVAHIGMSAVTDPQLWLRAFEHDQVVVTINATDFLRLAASVVLHPGLIVLRSQGLSREEQWQWVEPVVQALFASGTDLMNQVVEVTGPGKFTIRRVRRVELLQRRGRPVPKEGRYSRWVGPAFTAQVAAERRARRLRGASFIWLLFWISLERETGFEPATLSLGS